MGGDTHTPLIWPTGLFSTKKYASDTQFIVMIKECSGRELEPSIKFVCHEDEIRFPQVIVHRDVLDVLVYTFNGYSPPSVSLEPG